MQYKSFKDLAEAFSDSLSQVFSKSNMSKIGSSVLEKFIARVKSGGSVERNDGVVSKFKDLNELTARAKGGGRLCNLVDTGAMLNSLRVKSSDTGFTLYFNSRKEEQKAKYHNEGTKNLPKRPFMFLSNGEVRTVQSLLDIEITNTLGNI